ncbi:MAG: transporter [Epsilonproteobacteria bacterium]|nr:transporter [Campylobacterota bacterium]
MKNFLKICLVSSITFSSLFAYVDSDLDGVEDSKDQCPNTPFTDIVNSKGCSIKKLTPKINYHHYDVMVGVEYITSNFTSAPTTDTYDVTFQADYYYKDFSLQLSTSYYTTDSDNYSSDGMNDTYVGMFYRFHPSAKLSVQMGVGIILPTYEAELNNNNTDYSFSTYASYMFKKFNLFGSYTYTMINDDDTTVTYSDGYSYTYKYKNTNAFSFGVGTYITYSLYISTSYNSTESIYKNIDSAETISIYGSYNINKNWFTTLYYAYGLSDTASDHDISLKLGYYF